jgi:hypothetical protein
VAANRLAAEQGQQLRQHQDWAEAEVQAEVFPGVALARTANKMVLFYDFISSLASQFIRVYANLTSNFCAVLKNYFTSVGSSSSGSRPSTHESGIATTSTVGEVVQENEAMQDVAADLAHVDIGVDDAQPQQQPQQGEQEDEGINLITEFDRMFIL